MRIGFLCSGNLGYQCLQVVHNSNEISFVFTDKNSSQIIEFCNENQIKLYIGNPRKGRGYAFAREFEIDLIISINYLFLIEKDLISLPKKMAFNIHGSLLPKYRGRTPHVWAIINNESKTGITAHLIDEGCDTGDIIAQQEIEISKDDTGQSILNKFIDLYKFLLIDILEKIALNEYSTKKQDNELATCFGKRTAEDGEINWNWQREQIFNWVRALADPYPGAFTFYEGKKVIIDKIKLSDLGFSDVQKNGTILKDDENIIVKTPNGAIEILEMRNTENIKFKLNTFFDE